MSPFIWLFNGAANSLLRVFGVSLSGGEVGHSPAEIRFLVMQAQRGTLDESDRAMSPEFDFHEEFGMYAAAHRGVARDATATEESLGALGAIAIRFTGLPRVA